MFTLSAQTHPVRKLAVLTALFLFTILFGCDSLAPTQKDSQPGQDLSNQELETRIQEVFGSKVTQLHVRTIDVGPVLEELEAGETTIPIATPDSEVVQVNIRSRPANLLPDSVDTGALREGPETVERVPLPPEQSYLLGEGEGEGRYGGLTVLDDQHTMLRGFAWHPDYGLSYVQSVNNILQTDAYPNRHVIYNAKHTEPIEINDGDFSGSEGSGKALSQKGAKLKAKGTTSVVLDGDASFYKRNPSTVWRRQRSLFLAVKATTERHEPRTSGTWKLNLRIAGQEVWVSGGPSSKNPDQLIKRLKDPSYYLIHPLSPKQMHLFLVGYGMNGNDGQAGGIGTPSGGWGGGKGNNHLFSEANGPVLHFDQVLLTHETGHLLGGRHRDAIKFGCSGWACGRSIMNHNTPPNQYFFSDANDQRINSVINATLP